MTLVRIGFDIWMAWSQNNIINVSQSSNYNFSVQKKKTGKTGRQKFCTFSIGVLIG